MATSTKSRRSQRMTLSGRDPKLLVRIYEMMVLTRAGDRMVAMYKSGDLLGSLLHRSLA